MDELNKPKITFVAYYPCPHPDDCGMLVSLTFNSKVEVPSKHPEGDGELVRLVEVIETTLYAQELRTEGSAEAEKNVSDLDP